MVKSFDSTHFTLELQKTVLENKEFQSLINITLPKALSLLNESNLNYQFLGALFLDSNLNPLKFYGSDSSTLVFNTLPITLDKFLQNHKDSVTELLADRVILSEDVASLFIPQYFLTSTLKSFLIAPIVIANKLEGLVIAASTKKVGQIGIDDQNMSRIISNVVAHCFRLQDLEASLTDVTQEMYKMNAQLHVLDKVKDDFVSVASHELRTPMTAIRSYSWMALHRSDIPLSPKLQRYLSRTLISTERLINLVNDMLNISRIESGKVEILPEELDMTTLIKDVFEEILPKAQEKSLNLHLLESSNPKIFADPDKVHQILLNLLGNAMKFTPDGGDITISFFNDGKYLDTIIKDSGVGISKDDMSGLFKKFGRLDNSYVAAATTGGTGLGLFITRSLVELMKGKVWVHSEGLGKGTEFIFSLPIATPDVLSKPDVYTNKVVGGAKFLEPVAI